MSSKGTQRTLPPMAYRPGTLPERIVCLTEEPTEILYALGEGHRVVGISAYTVRPAEAKRDKPVVSAFIGGSVDKISALKPDLVIGFSDIQAELAKDLIAAGQQVLIWNQRSVQEILDVVVRIGALVGAESKAKKLTAEYVARIERIRAQGQKLPRRPRVYFEEWDEPRITAIEWVGELIEIAGGENIFADRAQGKLAKERFVTDEEILQADPELIAACWCGKKVDFDAIRSRPGYAQVTAMRRKQLVDFDPALLLQPGPACLTDGLDALAEAIRSATTT